MGKEENSVKMRIEDNNSTSNEIKKNKKKKKQVKQDTTHVSTRFAMNVVDFISKAIPSLGKQDNNLPIMATSPICAKKKENKMVSNNPMVMQV